MKIDSLKEGKVVIRLKFIVVAIGLLSIVRFGGVERANAQKAESEKKDIRDLSQQFIDPESMSPWVFGPEENIREISVTENPGYVTIRQEGKGKDIKGVLQDPIRIDDYPLPWRFHMGLVQNYLGVKGLVDEQINWAIGLNLVVTYSDPATWPKDRNQRPEDCEEVQLFVIHLGNQGENYRQGIPAIKHTDMNQWDYSPEVYLVYGRGDLDPKLNGDWKYNYTWVGPEPSLPGTWKRFGGPAEYSVRFTVGMTGTNSLEVGIGSGHDSGWRYRSIGVERPITGIWEIGPIISLDDWIPETLASELKLNESPMWIDSFREHHKLLKTINPEQEEILNRLKETFKVQPPDPRFEYYIDYMMFYGNGPENVVHLSEDFNVPGFNADQKYYIEGQAFGETYSNPGYLTITCYGQNGGWALCPILSAGMVELNKDRKPPFEIETCFIPPDNDRHWNYWWNVGLYDESGTMHPWQPCIAYVPGKGVEWTNSGFYDPKVGSVPNPGIKITPTFEPGQIETILGSKPIYFLVQIPNEYELRVGFKNNKEDPWVFSSSFNSKEVFGKIAAFSYPAYVSFQGGHQGQHGYGVGNYPTWHRFQFDYIHYRYSLSE